MGGLFSFLLKHILGKTDESGNTVRNDVPISDIYTKQRDISKDSGSSQGSNLQNNKYPKTKAPDWMGPKDITKAKELYRDPEKMFNELKGKNAINFDDKEHGYLTSKDRERLKTDQKNLIKNGTGPYGKKLEDMKKFIDSSKGKSWEEFKKDPQCNTILRKAMHDHIDATIPNGVPSGAEAAAFAHSCVHHSSGKEQERAVTTKQRLGNNGMDGKLFTQQQLGKNSIDKENVIDPTRCSQRLKPSNTARPVSPSHVNINVVGETEAGQGGTPLNK